MTEDEDKDNVKNIVAGMKKRLSRYKGAIAILERNISFLEGQEEMDYATTSRLVGGIEYELSNLAKAQSKAEISLSWLKYQEERLKRETKS